MGVLLGALVLHPATFVHAPPTSTSEMTSIWQDTPAMEVSDLELRQDAQVQDIPDILAKLPSGALNAAGKLLTPIKEELVQSVGIDTTRDNLARNVACADITVVFARGTTKSGNIGLVTGPPFFDALKEQPGGRSVAIQGIEYPVTLTGFNRNGTETRFINQAVAQCPDTKIAMSGDSQVALVVRSAAESLPAGTMAKINSVLTFGDPANLAAIPGADGKTKTICHENDAACSGCFITVDHLTCGEDASAATRFVIQRVSGELVSLRKIP
ncbi:Putative cutinase/acetylxylan esterase, alpha/Beta hydrolase [Colletotrichum destructivum]|uniref:cutinase n=1 Tax=Colletotrichum destructivum TaxID=34406 RepID=A0AAX4IMM4_9PEZI|nr:Putative cutinase/acetylxylan esterase, alpha/Beta hydrolase [Colletotrichum destructivum]